MNRCVTPLTIAGFTYESSFTNCKTQLKQQTFDKNRDGFVGEGSGILVLERESHAKRRGANILAEPQDMELVMMHLCNSTLQRRIRGKKAMEKALSNANMNIEDIQYINAHGTSTPYNDKVNQLQ